ncbi:MAG TPA: DUF1223 domain-containing protein [Pyrinomonadaceae bacterium]|jgi:hypothetical protein
MKKLLAIVFVVAALAAVAFVALSGQRAGRNAEPKKAEGAPSAEADGAAADKAGRAPVLVELFTSEGCSSCPPADAVLARLDERQPVEGAEVVPLAFHVDYWNHLGWADPFSSRQFSERQGEYSRAYGRDGVYTPQMIVDGVKEFPGGREGDAHSAVGEAARAPKGLAKLTRAGGTAEGVVRVSVRIENLPALTEGDAAFVLLAVTEGGLASDVARGENTGRRLGHVGVVRSLTTLGGLGGGGAGAFEAEADVRVEKSWRREKLRAVVFAQERGTRRVLAVGSVRLFG